MSSKYLSSTIDYIRLLVIIVILSLLALFVITSDARPWFLASSGMIVVLALINYIDLKDGNWGKFSLLMFIGMICGFIGDLLMNGIFYITPIAILNAPFETRSGSNTFIGVLNGGFESGTGGTAKSSTGQGV